MGEAADNIPDDQREDGEDGSKAAEKPAAPPFNKPKRVIPCPGCSRRFFSWLGLSQHQAMTGH